MGGKGEFTMKAIILAGGSGTGLWPLSRSNYPKQFLKINGGPSLLQRTAGSLLKVFSSQDIIVSTNREYKCHVNFDLNTLINGSSIKPFTHVICEPTGRNTAQAVALCIKYCLENLGCDDKELLFISPTNYSDITAECLIERISRAEEISNEGYIVILGVRNASMEKGCLYIKNGHALSKYGGEAVYQAESFVEGGSESAAINTIEQDKYYQNSGMYIGRIDSLLGEFKRCVPKIEAMLKLSYQELLSNFAEMPALSMEDALLGRSDRIVAMPLENYCNGTEGWDSLSAILEKDDGENVKIGDIMTLDTENTSIFGSKRLIATVGLKDCIVVETDDAVLITKKGYTDKVKDIVRQLKMANRKEAFEHVTTVKPWGNYTVYEEGDRYKIKRLVVAPGQKLSLQMHYHRSEHWVVVKGIAKALVGDKEIVAYENESIYIPKSVYHRLENPGKVTTEIIEIQNGEYLGEDDIVRTEDIYGRL